MKEKFETAARLAFRRLIVYSQEIVAALAWLAFAFTFDDAPLIGTLEAQYSGAVLVFHLAWALAGIFLLTAVVSPRLFISAWAFSGVIALCTHLATVTVVEGCNYSILYPITWGLLFILSVTQTIRHYWQDDDCGC